MPDTYYTHSHPDRKIARMKHYDYSLPGFYLVTVCVEKRQCVFGEISDGAVHLNDAGLIAQTMWKRLTHHFSAVRLDAFVVMPNHIHGILELVAPDTLSEETGNNPDSPQHFQDHVPQEVIKKANVPLGHIVRTFKGGTTHDVRHQAGRVDFEWQRGYYESILRTEKALDHARNYIMNNPLTWMEDTLRL